ncbi:hypothetical protein MBANPS3_003387 [Mucor bainieri]
MWSEIPREVLELIFTSPAIRKKDLLQLQLTCKQWGHVAQEYFYQSVSIADCNLYGDIFHDYSAMQTRFRTLMRCLRVNKQLGKYIKTVDISILFNNTTRNNTTESLSSSIITFAFLCPNLTILDGHFDSITYLETILHLHREGYFQRLEIVRIPDLTDATAIAKYHTTILEFKDTLKSITITDCISNKTSNECLIPPTSLQLFTSITHVELREFTRAHLYRIKDYVSNCGPHVRSLSIKMRFEMTTKSLQDEYKAQSAVQPRENVRDLSISLPYIIPNELAFIMRMFPSLKRMSLVLNRTLDETGFDQTNIQTLTHFFDYLSLITEVNFQFKWNDTSTGLDLFAHLAKSVGIKELTIISSNALDDTGISIDLKRPPQALKATTPDKSTERNKNEGFEVFVDICSTEVQASFARALEGLQSNSIKTISMGPHILDPSLPLQLDQQSLDYIFDHYKGVEFPSHAPQSANQTTKRLRYLHLEYCKITEDYFTALSHQFNQIDHFMISDCQWSYENNNLGKKMRIHLPYTTFKTISLDIDLGEKSCYVVRVWTHATCTTLNATQDQRTEPITFTLEELYVTESLVDDLKEVIIYCESVQEIQCWNAVFKMR